MKTDRSRSEWNAENSCSRAVSLVRGRYGLGLALACALVTGVAAEEPVGVIPLSQARDYPYHIERDDFSMGVKVLSPEEVGKRFASDLNRGYVVLEVAVYPPPDGSVKVSEGQFVLRQDQSRDYARAAQPAEVARGLQRTNRKKGGRDVSLYPQVGVGYSTGDPYYGRRGGGWNTSVGVGVGVGGSDPEASTDADRETMQLELSEKGLPGGDFDKPVAGYLYFPLTLENPKQPRLKLDFIADDMVAGASAARVSLYEY